MGGLRIGASLEWFHLAAIGFDVKAKRLFGLFGASAQIWPPTHNELDDLPVAPTFPGWFEKEDADFAGAAKFPLGAGSVNVCVLCEDHAMFSGDRWNPIFVFGAAAEFAFNRANIDVIAFAALLNHLKAFDEARRE